MVRYAPFTDMVYLLMEQKNYEILRRVYYTEPEKFLRGMDAIFDIPFRVDVFNALGIQYQVDEVALRQDIDSLCEKFCIWLSSKGLSSAAKEYLSSKGVTAQEITDYRIGSLDAGDLPTPADLREIIFGTKTLNDRPVLDTLWACMEELSFNVISYPSYESGRFVGVVFRHLSYKDREDKTTRHLSKFFSPYNNSYLFNIDAIDRFDHLYLTEGITDALAMIRAGYPNTISASMVRLSETHQRRLFGKKVSPIFDLDYGGLLAARWLLEKEKALPFALEHVALCPTKSDIDELPVEKLQQFVSNLPCASSAMRQYLATTASQKEWQAYLKQTLPDRSS